MSTTSWSQKIAALQDKTEYADAQLGGQLRRVPRASSGRTHGSPAPRTSACTT